MKNSLTQAVTVLRPFFCENCAPWFSTKKSAFLVSRMQNHFWLIVCNKSAHKSGGMQQQQKQPFSIQHIAAHSICRSKYLNKFFWLPTKHYLNFLLLLLFLFFLKITLMHICFMLFFENKARAAFLYMLCFVKLLFFDFDLSRVRNFFKKTCYLSFSRHFAAYEKIKKVWRRKNCT